MSLTKLLRAPVKLFRKDVITFLIIRRHDLGILEEKLRYVAVKPTASISVLRQKVWHLLDLPDYCEEAIVLKVDENTEIPLTHLRKGNDPQHPYILEVWLPDSRLQSSPSMRNNMLTMGTRESCASDNLSSKSLDENKQDVNGNAKNAISNATIALNAFRFQDNKCLNLLHSDYKKSDISCRISSTSMFKLGKKNKDSFTNILLKIQSDLCTLSNKLSNLENRIPL